MCSMDCSYWRHKVRKGENKEVAGVRAVEAVGEYVGSLPLLVPIMARLRLRDFVDHFCPMERSSQGGLTHGEIFEMMVLNRLTAPRPLCFAAGWASLYALDIMPKVDASKLNDDRIARMLDAVWEKSDEIQGAITMNMTTEFKISANAVHYDITSLAFEGDYEESEMIKFGYNRDKRPDLKQVNLSFTP